MLRMKIGLSNRTGNHFFGSKVQGRSSLVICWLIILTIAYSNYYNKFWKDPGRIIAHDVISYYQYLPATFIYKDISMKFLKDDTGYFERKIWATPTETGWYMGRMTMGLAVMYSPFFLVAHALAEPLGHEPNGYSPPYKAGLIIASLVYLALGLFLLRKFLRYYFPDTAVALTLLLIGLATNLYFYTVMEPTMSHVFSFCLYALFLLLLHNWLGKPGWRGAIFLGLTAGLITLVRPSNIIIVLLIPLWMVGNVADLRERLSFLIKRWGMLAVMAIFAFLAVFPQLLYWKFASGHWLEYTYNREGFFFGNPQFINGLFSYRKGWLVYAPVMSFAVAGLLLLAFRNRKLFWPVLVFSVVNMYIVFSWWSWWYGGGFGQRALIESYAVLSVPMAAFLGWALTGRWYLKLVILALSAWFIFLNIFQTRQYYYGAIHWEAMTKEAYWDSFLHYRPSDRFQYLIRYPDVDKALQGIYVDRPPKKAPAQRIEGMTYEEFIIDMETKIRADSDWMEKIRDKSERWGQPVDSVIRKDANWIWEQKKEKNE
jgi:hypothetical protein